MGFLYPLSPGRRFLASSSAVREYPLGAPGLLLLASMTVVPEQQGRLQRCAHGKAKSLLCLGTFAQSVPDLLDGGKHVLGSTCKTQAEK